MGVLNSTAPKGIPCGRGPPPRSVVRVQDRGRAVVLVRILPGHRIGCLPASTGRHPKELCVAVATAARSNADTGRALL